MVLSAPTSERNNLQVSLLRERHSSRGAGCRCEPRLAQCEEVHQVGNRVVLDSEESYTESKATGKIF